MPACLVPERHDDCPDQNTLGAFAEGQLSEPDTEQVAEHLETCPACEATLRDLLREPAHPFDAWLLRACADSSSTFAPSGAFARMEAAARGLCDEGTVSHFVPSAHDGAEPEGSLGTIGPYTLLEVLGRGGMSIVYRAFHRVLRRTVALKTLLPGRDNRSDALARFWVEAEAVARLRHPNVVTVEHFDDSPQGPYLTMELVPGGTLAQKLAHGPIAFWEAAELVQTLAAALEYAHGQNVVHRDLKPANVLLAADGTPKVADFGLAKIMGDDRQRLTHSDAVLGTPAYMAPEQAGQPRSVSPRTDVYALGAILYEALAGVAPQFSSPGSRMARLLLGEAVAPPSRYRPGVPPELEAICLKCLEPSQYDRYPTAGSLEQELARWLKGDPTETRPPGRFKIAARVFRKQRRAIATGALTVVAVFGAALAVNVLWFQGNKDPDGESESARRELEAELSKGRPVTLVGETGWPKWFRWRAAGAPQRRVHIEPDGTFSAEMLDKSATGLLEFLPDPKTDRYKLTAQLRHDRGEYPGFVGLYVAHKVYPHQPRDIQFFAQVTFDSVAGPPMTMNAQGAKKPIPEGTGLVELAPRLYAERGEPPNFEHRIPGARGARVPVLGARNDRWHDLELIVTPNGVTATLNGDVMVLTADHIQKSMNENDDPSVRALRPEYFPRGGIGLVLFRGAVSVRRVTVSPLSTN